MAIIATILSWFETGDRPTQQQFEDTFLSFRLKSDSVPVSEVSGIDELMSNFATNDALQAHLNDPEAHAELFAKVKVLQAGEFIIFKAVGNELLTLEINDFGCGLLTDGNFVPFGKYLGGNPNLVASWNTSPIPA